MFFGLKPLFFTEAHIMDVIASMPARVLAPAKKKWALVEILSNRQAEPGGAEGVRACL